MTKMSSKKNGNASARREKKMGGGGIMMRKPMPHGGKHTKGYARGGVISYSEDMPRLTPN